MEWLRRTWIFWINVVLLAVSLLVMRRWPSDFGIATLGAVLQAFGVFAVVYDLWRNAQLFDKGFLRTIAVRLRAYLTLGVTGVSAGLHGVLGGLVVRSFGGQRLPFNPRDPLHIQVATLHFNLTSADAEIALVYGEIHRAIAEYDVKAKAQMADLRLAVQAIDDKLEKSTIGNRYVLLIGAIWLVIGIFVSAWAHQIVLKLQAVGAS